MVLASFVTRKKRGLVTDGRKVTWYKSVAINAQFASPKIIPQGISSARAFAADVDGDGDYDLIPARERAFSWIENVNGTFADQQNVNTEQGSSVYAYSSCYAPAFADIDKDGNMCKR